MKPIIEFCLSNLASGTEEVKEKLEQDPNLDVIEYGCLGHCGQCGYYPFALVNGEEVIGKDNDDLLKNIYRYLEENPMF